MTGTPKNLKALLRGYIFFRVVVVVAGQRDILTYFRYGTAKAVKDRIRAADGAFDVLRFDGWSVWHWLNFLRAHPLTMKRLGGWRCFWVMEQSR